VLHPIEIYQGKVIFYSLANLVFGAHSNPKDPDTAVAQLVYSINGELRLNEVRVIPARMHENKNFQPFPYTREEDKQRVYRKMVFKNRDESGLPEDFIFTGSAVFNNP
jgi:poly-gamma-glutamate capsule biosynthesis protein CapA/YwtB (metallophosphatase superfamily)